MTPSWWEPGATAVLKHTATWTDGMRVTRLARHGRQLWIEIAYAGATHEIRLGPRTFKASRVRSQK